MTEEPHTWGDVVYRVAKKYDIILTDQEVVDILWNHTGYPMFWDTKVFTGKTIFPLPVEISAVDYCITQLHEFFAQVELNEFGEINGKV